MAITNPFATDQAASFAQSGVYKLDVSDVLSAILLDDTDFLSLIGVSGETAKQTKHQWVEDSLNATTVKQNGGNSFLSGTTATVIVMSASQISRITAGTLLRDQLSGNVGLEVLQVTGVNGISATVTRGYGSSSPSGHVASAVYEIIGNARPQGMNGPKDESKARAFSYNFTQIFSKGVRITGTAQAIEHYGVNSEDQYQIDMRMRELKRELSRTLLMGVRAPNDVAASTYGTMGGVIEFSTLLNTGNLVTTSETLVPSVVNALAKKVWDGGGMPDTLLLGGIQKQKVSGFDQEFRRSTLDSRRAGYTVEEFVTDLGVNLRIVVDRWMPNDTAIVLDSSKIKVLALQGRAFFLEKLAKTGDAENWQIVGEYTAEFRNAAETMSAHINLRR